MLPPGHKLDPFRNTFPEQYGINGNSLKQQTNGILHIHPSSDGGPVKTVHGGLRAFQRHVYQPGSTNNDQSYWSRPIQFHNAGPLHPNAMFSTHNIIIE